jgi:hypothetical protein
VPRKEEFLEETPPGVKEKFGTILNKLGRTE